MAPTALGSLNNRFQVFFFFFVFAEGEFRINVGVAERWEAAFSDDFADFFLMKIFEA
jgi:hypothetical protein